MKQQSTQMSYFSQSQYGNNNGSPSGLNKNQTQRGDKSDKSSMLSSVKMTEDYASVETLTQIEKPSQIATQFIAAFHGQALEKASEDSQDRAIKDNRKQEMLKGIGKELVVQMLGVSHQGDTGKHKKLRDSMADGFNPLKRKFTIDYIMRTFDVEKLRLLRARFLEKQKECEDGYELIEFVGLMKNVIPYEHPSEEYDLVHGLCNLFSEIDINGNGGLEWDEFTGFLIEAVDQKQLSSAGRIPSEEIVSENLVAQHVLRLEENQPDYLHLNNMLQVARSQIYQEYHLSSTFKDKLIRNSPIIEAILYHGTDTFITLESHAKSVKFLSAMSNQAIPGLSASTGQLTKVTQTVRLPLQGPQYILSVAFNEKDKVLALCSTDSLIYFYRSFGYQRDWKLFKIVCSHGIGCQVKMWYMPHHERWFSIGSQQQGGYSKKNVKAGAVQTLQQWHLPRSKFLSNKQMVCPDCQQFWLRSRGELESQGEHQIERPYVEEYDEVGNLKVCDQELRYVLEPFEHMNHRDDVKDVREIYHPYLALITACHDGKLRIISTQMKRCLGILNSGHSTGIRQIDYTPYHGASVLSVGYECFFNLWEVDNSLSFGKQMQDLPTKFTLLTSPCIAARFLGQSVFAVAIDSQFVVKIWNYKKHLAMQSLQMSTLKMQDTITGLLIFSEGKFAVLSKHVIFYDTISNKLSDSDAPQVALQRKDLEIRRMILREKGLSEIQQAANQQRNSMINPPLDVVFLESYQNFLVLSKDSMRVYNGNNGRLRMYLDKILEVDERTGAMSELSSMCLNQEHRMVFIGDIHGGIRVFNVNTGLQIQQLELPHNMLRKQGEASHKINKEVCGMQFYRAAEDCELLVSAHWNNRIRIWDVLDLENASHMRTASAQEVFNEDIQCVAVSEHLSLIATGSMFGMVMTWDFELFKAEGVLIGHKMAVVAMEFVTTYPLLVTAGQGGIIQVFAVRGAGVGLRRLCLGRFINVNYVNDKWVNAHVTAMAVECRPNPRYDPNSNPKGELALNVKYFSDKKKVLAAGDSSYHDVNWYTKSVYRARLDREIDEYTTIFNEATPADQRNTEDGDPEEGIFAPTDEDHGPHYEKFYPPFNNYETPEYLNVVITDESGSMKWLDLTTFIRQPREKHTDAEIAAMQDVRNHPRPPYIEKISSYSDSKIGFMPGRRMEAKAGSLAISLQEIAKKQKLPPLLLASKCVRAQVLYDAHKGKINSVRRINIPPFGYVTCGNDKFVRVWSQWGQNVGVINLIKEATNLNSWKFGYDWEQKRKAELEQAAKIVDELREDNSVITEEQEELEQEQTDKEESSIHSEYDRIKKLQQQKLQQKMQKQSQAPSQKSSKRKDSDVQYVGRTTLDALVKKKASEKSDHSDLIQKSENRLWKKQKDVLLDKKRKSISKKNKIWDVDILFPIPSKQREFAEQISEIQQQGKMIDKAVKNSLNLPGLKNPLYVAKRQVQSQSISRNQIKNASQKPSKKSSLKINTRVSNMKDMRKSQISFNIDFNAVGHTETNSSQIHQTQQQLKKQATTTSSDNKQFNSNNATSTSRSSDESDTDKEPSQGTIFSPQIRSGGYKSKADQILDEKVQQMNRDPNHRLDQLMQRTPSKKVLEMTGKTMGQIEKASQELNSYKAFEARYQKISQRSTSSIGTLRESTDRQQALREKWSNIPGLAAAAGENNGATEKPNSGASDKKFQQRQSFIGIPKPRKTLDMATSKNEIVQQAIKKTDEHLVNLIDECSNRHQEMQNYIDMMKMGESGRQNNNNTSQLDLKLGGGKDFSIHLGAAKDVLVPIQRNSIKAQTGEQSSMLPRESDRVSERPPRVARQSTQMTRNSVMESQRMVHSKSVTKQKQQTLHPKRSRFLSRIDKYINEASFDPSLDKKFMMRDAPTSQSNSNKMTMMQGMRTSNSVADFRRGDKEGAEQQSIFNNTQNAQHFSHNGLKDSQHDQQTAVEVLAHPGLNKNLSSATIVGVKKTGQDRMHKLKLKAKNNIMRQHGTLLRDTNDVNNQLAKQAAGAKDFNNARDIQRFIARHVSQKTFNPQSQQQMQSMQEQLRPSSAVKKQQQQSTKVNKLAKMTKSQSQQQFVNLNSKMATDHRDAHLGQLPIEHKRQTRVTEFLSKYNHQ